MADRPVAFRRWVNKKIQASETAPSSSNSSHPGMSSPVFIIDDDEEDEVLESAKKKSKLDTSLNPVNPSDSSDVERGLAEVQLNGADDDDDEIPDPDIPWRPPPPGAITPYVSKPPEWDWVVVSKKSGETVKDLRESEKVLMVKPLKTAAPANLSGELVVAEEGGEGEPEDDIFGDVGGGYEQSSDADPRILVTETLQTFEKIRAKLIREAEDPKRRGDIAAKAGKYMRHRNAWINRKKMIGAVPGVEVGDCFYYRFAILIIGLHQQIQAGISCMRGEDNETGHPVAISLVLSGMYEDDKDEGDTLLYTGEGGMNPKTRKQVEDQKLERGNLGLANSCKFDTSVRVIRGYIDPRSPSGKIYSYDGLYKVTNFWDEPGKSGFKVYKYRLEREPGQSERGSKLVKFCKKLQTKSVDRQGVVLDDISCGLELNPICVVNEVDPPALPPSFRYITKVVPPLGYVPPPLPEGCRCVGRCEPSRCGCVARNGGQLPYNNDGTLIDWRAIVYECGPACRCPPSCLNRVTQRKQARKLEVFKTENRGWGVRCWESLPFGSFICEYVGEMIENEEAERRVGNDEYIFDVDCVNGNTSRGVDVSCFFEEVAPQGGELCTRVEAVYAIDAAKCGNVTRFINHSCDPNLSVQCVFSDHHDLKTPHIMLFAMKHIKPLEELSYDYGYVLNTVKDSEGRVKKKACFCGSRKCRKRLY